MKKFSAVRRPADKGGQELHMTINGGVRSNKQQNNLIKQLVLPINYWHFIFFPFLSPERNVNGQNRRLQYFHFLKYKYPFICHHLQPLRHFIKQLHFASVASLLPWSAPKMSPSANFHGVHEQPKKAINGLRPSPLMINKDSHSIRKSSSSVVTDTKPKHPIIIYANSPKIIHTKPRDFMALVQRLTGMSRSKDEVTAKTREEEVSGNLTTSCLSDGSINNGIKEQQVICDNISEASSTLRDDETCAKAGEKISFSPSLNRGFADMPLFTPTPSDVFCSSRSVHKFSDSPYGSLGSLISPTGLEFIKELPEYWYL